MTIGKAMGGLETSGGRLHEVLKRPTKVYNKQSPPPRRAVFMDSTLTRAIQVQGETAELEGNVDSTPVNIEVQRSRRGTREKRPPSALKDFVRS
ncbi:hypothetical protein V6N11_007822 [Hibiscus sabdariffa]|uniref:Uncharacterized protein n=1 Tax=Hibiscus sabdariffa TaxID=183260 RepID=A0ABR2NJW2_9ROSI